MTKFTYELYDMSRLPGLPKPFSYSIFKDGAIFQAGRTYKFAHGAKKAAETAIAIIERNRAAGFER